VLLPNVLRFNLPAAPERYAEISVALGVERNGSAEATANKGLEVLSQLSRSCRCAPADSSLASRVMPSPG